MSLTYAEFLSGKAVSVPSAGLESVPRLPAKLFGFQRDAVAWALRRGCAALFFDCGLGKAQPVSEPVLTPWGWRPICELRPGDPVIGSDGKTTRVLGVYPQGKRPIFEVTFSDGARTRCDLEHLWSVRSENDASRGNPWRTMTLAQILEHGLCAASTRPTRQWRIPLVRPVELPWRDLTVDPYVMGVLLGDGSFRPKTSVVFTVADEEIAKNVEASLPDGLRVVKFGQDNRTPNYRIVTRGARAGRPNPVIEELRQCKLWGLLSEEKWIPEHYLFSSASQRLALLRGLMDTDGYVAKDGTVQFNSSSLRLAEGVLALVRSLGGICRMSSKVPTYRYNGELREGLAHWTVTIALPNEIIPFRLERKVARWRKRPKYLPVRKIESVKPAGMEDAVCIRVEDPSQLYVTRDFVVTHNTPMQVVWADQVVAATGRPVLILAPLAVAQQTVREGAKFDVPVTYCAETTEVGAGVHVTNYERLSKFDPSAFGGVVLDESSILKSYTGPTKRRLLEAFKATPFKLACSATPAPNDHLELGNHAEFLGVMTSHEMLARWFLSDFESGEYRLKGHAVRPFWDWVTSWARCAGKPSDVGHSDDGFVLPELRVIEHVLEVDQIDGRGENLFRIPDLSATSIHKEKRRTAADRAAAVAEAVRGEPEEQWLIWADTDYEADALAEVINEAVNVHGGATAKAKESALLDFADGKIRVLITKPKLAGLGMNFQGCARMAFIGPSFSFEQYYQAVRRVWRFGQRRAVQVHVFMAASEAAIWSVVRRKAEQHRTMTLEMFEAARRSVESASPTEIYLPNHRARVPEWLRSA